MVDLEPVGAEETAMTETYHQSGDLETHGKVDILADMTRFDAERLRQLIQNHLRYTGSTRARDILDNWAVYRPKFRKVMPIEYRRALTEMAAKKAQPKRLAAAGE
jgi:glutamate synthase (NADPH/NADH) large chain